MKYCTKCGQQLDDNAQFCTACGAQQNPAPQQSMGNGQGYQQTTNHYENPQDYPANNANDSGSFGWAVLGFCIPLVGLILYLVWKGEKPLTAKKAGMGALISFCLSLLFSFIGGMMG